MALKTVRCVRLVLLLICLWGLPVQGETALQTSSKLAGGESSMIAGVAGAMAAKDSVQPFQNHLRWMEATAEMRLCPGFHGLSFSIRNASGQVMSGENLGDRSSPISIRKVQFIPLYLLGGQFVTAQVIGWRAGDLLADDVGVVELRLGIDPSFAMTADAEIRIAMFARSGDATGTDVDSFTEPVWIRILPYARCERS